MNATDDNEIRNFLLLYEIAEPNPELVTHTERLMREEMVNRSLASDNQAKWVLILVGYSIIMCLGIFYIFTVGALLNYILPAYLVTFLHYSLYVFPAAGGSLLAGLLMVFYFKQFTAEPARHVEQFSWYKG